jgi:alpha-glucosidase
MFAHWLGVGAFFPFCRAHTAKDTRNKEPWVFGGDVEDICRTSLQRRYRLLPYLYTLFYASSQDGLPVMRPLFFADPDDQALRAEDDAFLLGADLLVAPVLTPGGQRTYAQPAGIWRTITLLDEDCQSHSELAELKIRGGAIIPLGKVAQNTSEDLLETLTLVVCLDESGIAKGTLYEDAYEGHGYKEGQYLLTEYEAHKQADKVIVKVAGQRGKMSRPRRNVQVELVTDNGVIEAAGRDGQEIVVQ